MKNMWRSVLKYMGWTCLLISFGLGIYIPFSHPEMTQTQLFLNYWMAYLFIIILSIVGCYEIVTNR
jgi:hypothetical protein